MFKGIRSLKPGHYVLVRNGKVEIKEYWDLVYPTEGEKGDSQPESFYVERLDELLRQAVRYRLHADVPVGFYLSGGLDSSLIASIISTPSRSVFTRPTSTSENTSGSCRSG